MKPLAIILCLFTIPLVFGADEGGVLPRVDRTRYAVAIFNESMAVAAELVPPEKVRKLFGADVDRHFLVVEVGMYPGDKKPINVRLHDFTLRVNRTRAALSSQLPKAIADFGANLRDLAMQLLAKSLPETSTYRPVAGYLYFPVKDKTYGDYEYELEYRGHKGSMILPLLAGSSR